MSDISKAIDNIADLARKAELPKILEIDGLKYIDLNMKRFAPPRASPLEAHTLQAVVDYVTRNPDSLTISDLIVHVVGPRKVTVFKALDGEHRDRENYLDVNPMNQDGVAGFVGQFHDPEEFIMGLQTRFAMTSERDDLLAIVGNLVAGSVKNIEDDGVSQTLTVKRSVRAKDETLKNPVSLTPLRTFPEIELDPVEFVLRARGGGENETPAVGLFSSDNGEWKVDAINKIRLWLLHMLDPEDGALPFTMIA